MQTTTFFQSSVPIPVSTQIGNDLHDTVRDEVVGLVVHGHDD